MLMFPWRWVLATKKLDIHMPCPFAARPVSVGFEQSCAQVALVHFRGLEGIAFGIEKISYPKHGRHVVMYCHHHDLGGAGGVYLFAARTSITHVVSKGHIGPGVTPHVSMY